MQRVFVVDIERRPLMPCHPARARILLKHGKAAILRRFPYTIVRKEAKPDAVVTPLRVKIDPGSKTTGMAVVNDGTGEVVFAAEVEHRGPQVKDNLDQRRVCRRSWRQRHMRYRAPRFDNRRRRDGWLPPSFASRIQNVLTWVGRMRRWAPIGAISVENVTFDTQLMQHPEMSGVDYQQGDLQGYDVREYLLEEWGRRCAYCGATNVALHIEHIVPTSRHGSDQGSNLCLACEPCNKKKNDMTAAEFGFPKIQAQAKAPLRDAAAVNSTRRALYQRLLATGLPLQTGSGGLTTFNRPKREIPKAHWLDAANVGTSTPERLRWQAIIPLMIKAQGWQRRQMCLVDTCGFPRTKSKEQSRVHGFQTSDVARAIVATGAKAGTYVGRVAVRARGFFNVLTANGLVTDISYRNCRRIHAADGYQ